MAPILIILTALTFTFAAILYPLVVSRLINVHGAFRTVVPQNNTNCAKVEGLEACEQFSVHPSTGLVYLACSTQETRKYWGPYWLIFDQPSTEDYVGLYNPAATNPDQQIRRLKLQGFSDPRGLNVHGMDLVPSRQNPNEAFVYLVNHRPQLEGNSAEVGADSVIELFKTLVGSDSLVHVKTFEDASVIQTPNSISGSPDGNSFFFTNDYGAEKVNLFKRTAQIYLNLASTSVGYCDIESGCQIAAEDVKGANGITRTSDDTIFVAEAAGGMIGVYERQADNTLVLVRHINLERTIDNLTVDVEGSVYAATFVRVLTFLQKTAHDHSYPSPSSVHKISLNTGHSAFFGEVYKVEKIFEDDGSLATGITTAFADLPRKRLYMHGILAPALVYCNL